MISYVSVKPSRLMNQAKTAAASIANKGYIVRRPIKGMMPKNEHPVRLRLISLKGDGFQDIPNSNMGSGKATYATNFIIMHHNYSLAEKQQIMDTFGGTYIFLFGEAPVVHNFGGYLLNTASHTWYDEWLYIYENFLRGTKALENRVMAVVEIDNLLIGGYILSSSYTQGAESPEMINFSFSMIESFRTFIDSPQGKTPDTVQFFADYMQKIKYWHEFGAPIQPKMFLPGWITAPLGAVDTAVKMVGEVGDIGMALATFAAKAVTRIESIARRWSNMPDNMDSDTFFRMVNTSFADIKYILNYYQLNFWRNAIFKPLEAYMTRAITYMSAEMGIEYWKRNFDIIYVGNINTKEFEGIGFPFWAPLYYTNLIIDKIRQYAEELHNAYSLSKVILSIGNAEKFRREVFWQTGATV